MTKKPNILVDLAPTVLDVLGLDTNHQPPGGDPHLQGTSLLPAVRGQAHSNSWHFAEVLSRLWRSDQDRLHQRCIRSGRYKLVHHDGIVGMQHDE